MEKMSEREEFENHCRGIGRSITKFVDGDYKDDGTATAWYWFRAGRSLLSQEAERPLSGNWRHNQGYICNGTLRIAKEDFDTNPTEEFKHELFDWICNTLNAKESAASAVPAGYKLVPIEPSSKMLKAIMNSQYFSNQTYHRNITLAKSFYKVAIEAAPTIPASKPTRCPYCDNTGDVHRADGEWLGECKECKP